MKKLCLHTILIAVTFCFCASASSASFYTSISAGYSNTEVDSLDDDYFAYRLNIAYEIDQQWYIELGYQSFADDSLDVDQGSQLSDGINAKGAYIAALGKAQGQSGELFYRIGLMGLSVETVLSNNSSCDMAITEQFGRCQFDEEVFAGIVGLGFDYYLSRRLLLRSEFDYIQGTNNFSSSLIHFGLRFNF